VPLCLTTENVRNKTGGGKQTGKKNEKNGIIFNCKDRPIMNDEKSKIKGQK